MKLGAMLELGCVFYDIETSVNLLKDVVASHESKR